MYASCARRVPGNRRGVNALTVRSPTHRADGSYVRLSQPATAASSTPGGNQPVKMAKRSVHPSHFPTVVLSLGRHVSVWWKSNGRHASTAYAIALGHGTLAGSQSLASTGGVDGFTSTTAFTST